MNRTVQLISRWLTPQDRANLATTCATMYDLPALYSTRACAESRAIVDSARDIFMSCVRANHTDDPAMCEVVRRLFPLFLHGGACDRDPAFLIYTAHMLSCRACICGIARVCSREYLSDVQVQSPKVSTLTRQNIIEDPHCLSCAVVIAHRNLDEIASAIPSAGDLLVIDALVGCRIRSFLIHAEDVQISIEVTTRALDVASRIIARNADDATIDEYIRNARASRLSRLMVRTLILYLSRYLDQNGRLEWREKIAQHIALLESDARSAVTS